MRIPFTLFRPLSVFIILFIAFNISIAQISRYTEIPSTDFSLPTIDYSHIYTDFHILNEQKKESAIHACLNELLIQLINDIGNKDATIEEYVVVNSTWIKALMLVRYKLTGVTRVIMLTQENNYIFKMSKRDFLMWVSVPSKGEFYHSIVKNNMEFSFRPICETLIK